MHSRITAALSLVPLGLVVSALMLAWFKEGMKAFGPSGLYKLWPRESRHLFLSGIILYVLLSIADLIIMKLTG